MSNPHSSKTLSLSLENIAEIASGILEMMGSECSIVLFVGDLGAGKTTLIQSICSAMDCKDQVSSPTYSLVNEYEDGQGNSIYHMDLYRLKSTEEALDIGIMEYLDSGDPVFIEWPEKIRTLLPERYLEIVINQDAKQRTITANQYGKAN